MKLEAYASLAAFLAHWRVLRAAPPDQAADDDRARLAAMEEILTALRPDERAALEASASVAGATARHRQRAELRLARVLRARALLAP